MLNHTWPLITTVRKVLTSNLTVATGDGGGVSDPPSQDVNWGAAGQVDMVLSATGEAMSAVQSAAVHLHTSHWCLLSQCCLFRSFKCSQELELELEEALQCLLVSSPCPAVLLIL